MQYPSTAVPTTRGVAPRDPAKSGATHPAPLAEASRRLRGRPGRPKAGHVADTLPRETRINSGAERSPSVQQSSVLPRLLGVQASAAYLSLSPWTIRDLIAAGSLHPVRLVVGDRPVRRLLLDRQELDRLVESHR